MNILLLANIYPYEIGGAEIQAKELAEAWLHQGHSVTIAGNKIPKGIKILFGSSGNCITYFHLSTITTNRLFRGITYTMSLLWFLNKKKKNFDFIYCRFIKDAAIVVSFLKRIKLISNPLMVCAEGAGKTGDAEFLKKLPWSSFIVTLLKKECNTVNIISPTIENELVALRFNKKKFSYIANGIRLANIPRSKSCYGNRKIIFVGRLCKQKGLIYLFKAIEKIKNNFDINVTIAGDGPDKKHLEYLAKEMQLDDVIKFIGIIRHENIYSQLNKHDIFVLPSLAEGFGIAVIEAMSAGLPVVVTKCGGPEYFVDNFVGRIAQKANTNSLTHALKELLELSNEKLHSMGEAAQRRIKENYEINTVATKHIELFNTLLSNSYKIDKED